MAPCDVAFPKGLETDADVDRALEDAHLRLARCEARRACLADVLRPGGTGPDGDAP